MLTAEGTVAYRVHQRSDGNRDRDDAVPFTHSNEGLAADQECQGGSPPSPDLRASAARKVGSRPTCDALQDGLGH